MPYFGRDKGRELLARTYRATKNLHQLLSKRDYAPVGILLVANKNSALVEYAMADNDKDIFVSKYLLELPTKEQLIRFVNDEFTKL